MFVHARDINRVKREIIDIKLDIGLGSDYYDEEEISEFKRDLVSKQKELQVLNNEYDKFNKLFE